MTWFQVDRKGLANLTTRQGMGALLFELLQNAWDTEADTVILDIDPVPRRPVCLVRVYDNDPEGFRYLEHAYTLFSGSTKLEDPEKRGRFNLGEKMVLAHCNWAKITTTKGTLFFEEDGTLRKGRKKTDEGTIFEAEMRMTRAESEEALEQLKMLIPPAGVVTHINGLQLPSRHPLAAFKAKLPTVIGTEEGVLVKRTRETEVRVFKVRDGETPMLYEMGIPVCPWDQHHVDIHQKVPLGFERDNVSEAYRRRLRATLLNECPKLIDEDTSASSWVTDALEDPRISDDAVTDVVTKRFGKNAVIYDPSDREASQRAAAKGWVVVHGRNLSKGAWDAVKRAGALKPAGQVLPTPKPYSDDPNASPVDILPEDRWTEGMKDFARKCTALARHLGITSNLRVTFVTTPSKFAAAWGDSTLDIFLSSFGEEDFVVGQLLQDRRLLELVIHEFAHHYEESHTSDRYHRACCRIGAEIAILLHREGVEALEG